MPWFFRRLAEGAFDEQDLHCVMGMRQVRTYPTPNATDVYEMGEGGPAAELHVAAEPSFAAGAARGRRPSRRLPLPDVAYAAWAEWLRQVWLPQSGPVDRFWFHSLYLRERWRPEMDAHSKRNKENKMGLLIDGVWHDQWYDTKSTGGRFVRQQSAFRNWITPDGSPGPSGVGGYKAEPGRYHLYVSLACPWAHRTLIFRKLKVLEDLIGVSVVHWLMLENGWTFAEGSGVVPDPVFGARFLYEIYARAEPRYTGRVTVPMLWDKKTGTIVNNESSEIIRMFNSAFDQCGAAAGNYYPEELRSDIDALNERIYDPVNNGVYKAGFATTQEAYDAAFAGLFETLDVLDKRLSTGRYLLGDRLTEADWRLFTTLVRFDPVYVGHFKCNLRRIADYPNLSGYLRDLYQMPGIAETVNMAHIKGHYYQSHRTINPTGIVPKGPEIDLDQPSGRG